MFSNPSNYENIYIFVHSYRMIRSVGYYGEETEEKCSDNPSIESEFEGNLNSIVQTVNYDSPTQNFDYYHRKLGLEKISNPKDELSEEKKTRMISRIINP